MYSDCLGMNGIRERKQARRFESPFHCQFMLVSNLIAMCYSVYQKRMQISKPEGF